MQILVHAQAVLYLISEAQNALQKLSFSEARPNKLIHVFLYSGEFDVLL